MKAAIFQPPYPRKGEEKDTVLWILGKMSQIVPGSVDLILLPEYSNCLGAGTRNEVLEAISGYGKHLTETLLRECKRIGAVIIAGVVTMDENGMLGNKIAVYEPDKEPYYPYTKNYPVEAEYKKGIVAGAGPGVFEINGVRYGAAICFDFYFPELFAKYAEARIDVLIMASLQRRETADRLHYLSRARAFDCGCTLLRSSVAMPDTKDIAGRSMHISPSGEIIDDAGGEACVLMVDFNPSERFVQPVSYDMPDKVKDYRETRLEAIARRNF